MKSLTNNNNTVKIKVPRDFWGNYEIELNYLCVNSFKANLF